MRHRFAVSVAVLLTGCGPSFSGVLGATLRGGDAETTRIGLFFAASHEQCGVEQFTCEHQFPAHPTISVRVDGEAVGACTLHPADAGPIAPQLFPQTEDDKVVLDVAAFPPSETLSLAAWIDTDGDGALATTETCVGAFRPQTDVLAQLLLKTATTMSPTDNLDVQSVLTDVEADGWLFPLDAVSAEGLVDLRTF